MTKWKLVPENVVTGEMASAFAKVFSVRCQHETFAPAFQAAIEAAPKPPVLSDERIAHHLDAILKASGSGLKNYSIHKTIEDMKQAVRAIEREILGGSEK